MAFDNLLKELTLYANESKSIWEDLNDEQSFGEYVAYTYCLELLNKYKRKENL